MLRLEKRAVFVNVHGNPCFGLQAFKRPALVEARFAACSNAIDAVLAYQVGQDQLWRAVQHQQILAEFLQSLPQRIEAFAQKSLPLDAHTGNVAPGPVEGPYIYQQQAVGTTVCQQAPVVIEPQVVAKPVEMALVVEVSHGCTYA